MAALRSGTAHELLCLTTIYDACEDSGEGGAEESGEGSGVDEVKGRLSQVSGSNKNDINILTY